MKLIAEIHQIKLKALKSDTFKEKQSSAFVKPSSRQTAFIRFFAKFRMKSQLIWRRFQEVNKNL